MCRTILCTVFMIYFFLHTFKLLILKTYADIRTNLPQIENENVEAHKLYHFKILKLCNYMMDGGEI